MDQVVQNHGKDRSNRGGDKSDGEVMEVFRLIRIAFIGGTLGALFVQLLLRL